MNRWVPNLYINEGKTRGISDNVIDSSLAQAHRLQDADLPPVLTLGHLAFHTDISYKWLRKIVSRQIDPYRTFYICKRSGGKRYISVPKPKLLKVQKWIDRFILSKGKDSPYSYAFKRGSSIIKCAEQHLGCKWLIKIDLRHFFESLSEIQTYRVFNEMGYGELLSFEMARLCTKVLPYNSRKYKKKRWNNWGKSLLIPDYSDSRVGHLPQGVPTSPKLANLIVSELDYKLSEIAKNFGLVYTRYADDMIFSTGINNFNRTKGYELVRQVYNILPKHGLRPHPQKVQIVPPGARKIVLGLLVDGPKITLTKLFRARLDCHLYYSSKDPIKHAEKRGFHSVMGLKNYVNGLMSYAKQVNPEYLEKITKKCGMPNWPI
jgi:RNA-directed DNA polymerase